MVAEAHCETCASTRGLSSAIEARRGTNSGDPSGGLLWNFVVTSALYEDTPSLCAAGVRHDVKV